jgi:nucleoside-diphosphate-sugar epimerase
VTVIAVVGATGALGSYLCEHLVLTGHVVRRVARSSDDPLLAIDVLEPVPHDLLSAVDAVVYCAWSTTERTSDAQDAHVDAADRWARSCASLGVQFLFMSSVLARPESRSTYAVAKWRAESAVRASSGIALRVGLVADDAYPFLLTTIRRTCRRVPGLARLVSFPVYAVATTDVGDAVARVVADCDAGSLVWVAPRTTTSLGEIALWDGARHTVRPIGTVLGRAVARARYRRGSVGRYLDAWAGLVLTDPDPTECGDPPGGAPGTRAWARTLAGPA